jgi:hypothetical protein
LIDVFERMYDVIVAPVVAENFQSAVGDHLVGVHIGRRSSPALDLIDHELVVQRTAADLHTGRDNRFGDLGVELSELLIGLCGCLFHRGECDHKIAVPRDGHPTDGKVLQCARCVHTVVDIGRNFPIAEQIVLDADGGMVVAGQCFAPVIADRRCGRRRRRGCCGECGAGLHSAVLASVSSR